MRGSTSASAFGPPVEVPIVTISMRRCKGRRTTTLGRGGGSVSFATRFPQSALILGISSARMASSASSAPPMLLLGLVA